jgi:hypothetical protein
MLVQHQVDRGFLNRLAENGKKDGKTEEVSGDKPMKSLSYCSRRA